MNAGKWIAVVAMLAVIVCVAGCGNVSLQGDGLTAAETSTMDAYQAAQRAGAEPNCPTWLAAYTVENFQQWRFFVRSARKDLNWGPKLQAERSAGSE